MTPISKKNYIELNKKWKQFRNDVNDIPYINLRDVDIPGTYEDLAKLSHQLDVIAYLLSELDPNDFTNGDPALDEFDF